MLNHNKKFTQEVYIDKFLWFYRGFTAKAEYRLPRHLSTPLKRYKVFLWFCAYGEMTLSVVFQALRPGAFSDRCQFLQVGATQSCHGNSGWDMALFPKHIKKSLF